MAVLVGKYLVVGGARGSDEGSTGHIIWRGFWTISASKSGDGNEWEIFARGETAQGFLTTSHACHAAEQEGMIEARKLQNDHTLQPILWTTPTPSVPQG